ncbi:MAG: HAMP domain-containing histidine kinase, partial [Proteobacteria bacterium]
MRASPFPTFLFLAVVAASMLAMLGWQLDIEAFKSLVPGYATTKFNTAAGLLFLAIAALLHPSVAIRSRKNAWSAGVLAAAVWLLAALSAAEFLWHLNFGIDEFFYLDANSRGSRWPPGRPSPVTLFNFLALSTALMVRLSSQRWSRSVGQALLLITWLVAFQSVVCYVLDINASFGSAIYTQMSIPTALMFSALATGLLLDHRLVGFGHILRSHLPSGSITRKLLLAGIVLPPLVTVLESRGIELGWWDAEFGAIVRILGNVFVFSWLAIAVGNSLRKGEIRNARTQNDLRSAIEGRDTFLSLAAHELRTPLTALKMQNQMQKRFFPKIEADQMGDRFTSYLDNTGKQLERLVVLVNDMLDTSRIDLGKMDLRYESFDLVEAAQAAANGMAGFVESAGARVAIHAPQPVIGSWDRSRIEQVFTNLLNNAVKYGDHAGHTVEVILSEQDGRAFFSVHNFGRGVAKHDHERIFQRFERAVDHHQSGFGLGLFLVREIV